MNLKDQCVLVTGASRGIGRAVVIAFAKQGRPRIKFPVNKVISRRKSTLIFTRINNSEFGQKRHNQRPFIVHLMTSHVGEHCHGVFTVI